MANKMRYHDKDQIQRIIKLQNDSEKLRQEAYKKLQEADILIAINYIGGVMNKTPKTFWSREEVCTMLDVKCSTLMCWIKDGYIVPREPAPKQGKAAYYDRQNLQEIQIFKRLTESGMSRELAKRVMFDSNMLPGVIKNNQSTYKFTITVTTNEY